LIKQDFDLVHPINRRIIPALTVPENHPNIAPVANATRMEFVKCIRNSISDLQVSTDHSKRQ